MKSERRLVKGRKPKGVPTRESLSVEGKMKSERELIAVYKLRKWKGYWEGGTEHETAVKKMKPRGGGKYVYKGREKKSKQHRRWSRWLKKVKENTRV